MMRRATRIALGALVITALAGLASYRLDDSPAYLNLDEAHFGNHGHSLARTAADLNGNRLPLFISLEDPLGDRPTLQWGTTWYHPYGFYLIASSLLVAPVSEWSIRLPIALIALLDVWLIYLVALRWFESRVAAVVAAALLAMTPAHVILSRLALDYLLPLPCALAWLLAISSLMRHPDRRHAAITGLVLGLGCYSYVSSWLMMPLYLAVTSYVLFRLRHRDLLIPVLGAFALAMLPLVVWVAFHPAMPGNILAQYQVGETRPSVLRAVITGSGVAGAWRSAINAYWSYFDPSFLFVTGGSSRLVSTGTIGVWPFGVAILLLLSVPGTLRSIATPQTAILAAGLLLAPLPAALKGEPFAIQRAITILPFGILIATGSLRGVTSWLGRAIVVVALVSVPFQFSGFLEDYFGAYRVRAAHAVDPTSFRDTAEALIARAAGRQDAVILLPTPLYDVSAKWRFYCTKHGALDLLPRTRYFSGRLSELSDVGGPNVFVVIDAEPQPLGDWRVVAEPRDITGDAPLRVVQRPGLLR